MERSASSLLVEAAVVVSGKTGVPVEKVSDLTPLAPHAIAICVECADRLKRAVVCNNIKMTFGDLRRQLGL